MGFKLTSPTKSSLRYDNRVGVNISISCSERSFFWTIIIKIQKLNKVYPDYQMELFDIFLMLIRSLELIHFIHTTEFFNFPCFGLAALVLNWSNLLEECFILFEFFD